MIINRKKMTKKLIATCLCVGMIVPMCASAATYEELINVKETAHEIAEQARSIGLDDTHDIIASAQEVWHKADDAIKNEEYDMYMYYTEDDVRLIAETMWCEGRGTASKTELACIAWTILNRYDAGYGTIECNIRAENQFCHYDGVPTISDKPYCYDLKELARDVLNRWNKEKNGVPTTGRVLPSNYLWFSGWGGHNHFRDGSKIGYSNEWNYSLHSPYEN